jgi:glycosyltransferase involved in cell wall biosynthesis
LAVAGGFGNVYLLLLSGTGRFLGYRIFLEHHNFNYLDRRSLLAAALIRIAGGSAIHAVLSAEMGRRLKRLYGNVGTVAIVSNAARVPAHHEPPQAHDGPLVIGHLSNLSWEKGLGVVLDLFARLVAAGINVRFELVGPATGSELAAIEAADAGGRGRLRWRGPIYGDEKLNFLRSLDLFCFPTQYKNEAQPLVLFEALSCGAPVVAFGRGCIPEDITPNFGTVVPVGDDFVATVMPLIRRWAEDRAAVENLRIRAWSSYGAAHKAASEGLLRWLDRLAEVD